MDNVYQHLQPRQTNNYLTPSRSKEQNDFNLNLGTLEDAYKKKLNNGQLSTERLRDSKNI